MSTKTEPVIEPVVETPEVEDAKSETEPLGAPGLAALQSEREARKAAEKATNDALTRIKEFEDRDKTETQKQADRLTEIEAENSGLRSAQTRSEVAEAKSDPEKGIIVPAALLTGSTREELEASADALIAFRGDPQPQRLHVPNEGLAPTGDDDPSSQFASFMKTQLGQ